MSQPLQQTGIEGVYLLESFRQQDKRGAFVKPYRKSWFAEHQLETDFVEDYYSVSAKNVFRGLHFQRPPHAHTKLVYCTCGEALDILVDLRRGSATYGMPVTIPLSAAQANAVYIPVGIAHGFIAKSDQVIMHYKTSTEYAPEHDAGINIESVGLTIDTSKLILSDRDRALPSLQQFDSPFSHG